MIDQKTLEKWGYTLERHSHYSPKTQAAVRAFQICFASYQALKKTDWNAATYWSNESQIAWNRLVRCRREETGKTLYLNKKQYVSSLVDWQIEGLCKKVELIVPYNDLQLNPASYDVLLGDEILIEKPSANGLRVWESCSLLHQSYWLQPGELVLGCTQEVIKIPHYIESVFCLKSSRGREGFDHVLSAYIDPGFCGRVTLEIHNSNRFNSLKLYAGLRIGQLRFSFLSENPKKTYDVTGRYHLDMGPEPSKG